MDLYQRLLEHNVTQDNVWTLTSENLERMGLTLKDQTRYLAAKEAEETKTEQESQNLISRLGNR